MTIPARTVPLIQYDDRTGQITKAWADAFDELETSADAATSAIAAHETRIALIETRLTPPTRTLITTFLAGWTNFGGTWTPAGYWVDAYGIVHLSGLIAGGTVGLAAFQMPVGLRPALAKMFTCACETQIAGRIDVFNDGTVVPESGTNGFQSLDNISYQPGT